MIDEWYKKNCKIEDYWKKEYLFPEENFGTALKSIHIAKKTHTKENKGKCTSTIKSTWAMRGHHCTAFGVHHPFHPSPSSLIFYNHSFI